MNLGGAVIVPHHQGTLGLVFGTEALGLFPDNTHFIVNRDWREREGWGSRCFLSKNLSTNQLFLLFWVSTMEDPSPSSAS